MEYAIIGDDGTRPVVWGLGESEAAALADAALQNDGVDIGAKRVVTVTTEQADRIRAGVVSVDALGLASA